MSLLQHATTKFHFATVAAQNLSLPLGREVAATTPETPKTLQHGATSMLLRAYRLYPEARAVRAE